MKAGIPDGMDIMYERGCDWTEEIETKYSELGDERAWEYEILHRKVNSGEKADQAAALRLAKKADVIVAAVGENVMLCGENRDREGLRLPGKQEQFVNELLKTGKPVVLVIFGGRAQVVSGLAERCAAVIQAWYPGEEGGRAVADILYGKVSPSAKLSVSYPNTEVYEPICYNYTAEQDSRVQWPFGYGLSYTTFEYQNLKADAEVATNAETVSLSFEVKNTGNVAADEIAQIYLSPTSEDQHIRPQQLQGFVFANGISSLASTSSRWEPRRRISVYSRKSPLRAILSPSLSEITTSRRLPSFPCDKLQAKCPYGFGNNEQMHWVLRTLILQLFRKS